MNLTESIGKRLAQLRKEHHMTQEQLAEKLDISIKHCSCVERGTASLSLERMLDVCELFNVTLDYLIRGISPDGIRTLPPKVLDTFRDSSESEQKLLLEYLDMYHRLVDHDKKKENVPV